MVLLSGGLDSATALAWARAQGHECHALSVAYGQRHSAELDAAARVASALGAREHRLMRVDLGPLGSSALTDATIAVPEQASDGIPVTYVPARNTVLLALALAWAEVLGATRLVIGVNAVDYSGYPDCRPEFIAAFERLSRIATRAGIEGSAHAPGRAAPCLEQGEDHPRGAAMGGRLCAHRLVLPGGRAGPGLRALRFLSPAARRL